MLGALLGAVKTFHVEGRAGRAHLPRVFGELLDLRGDSRVRDAGVGRRSVSALRRARPRRGAASLPARFGAAVLTSLARPLVSGVGAGASSGARLRGRRDAVGLLRRLRRQAAKIRRQRDAPTPSLFFFRLETSLART